MVGLSHINQKNRYSFVLRFSDGYAVGLAEDELTPKEIAEAFQNTDMVNIAFLDGGGSAQFGRWNDTEFEYVRDTGRTIPSAVCIYREPVTAVGVPAEQNDEVADVTVEESDIMTDEKQNNNVPVAQESMEEKKTIIGQIAALIDVKSIMTFLLVTTLCYLVIHGKELDDKFMTIVTAVVTFYFSYQVKK